MVVKYCRIPGLIKKTDNEQKNFLTNLQLYEELDFMWKSLPATLVRNAAMVVANIMVGNHGRQKNGLQRCPCPNFGICEYIRLSGKVALRFQIELSLQINWPWAGETILDMWQNYIYIYFLTQAILLLEIYSENIPLPIENNILTWVFIIQLNLRTKYW